MRGPVDLLHANDVTREPDHQRLDDHVLHLHPIQ
jgi:hypothetical protein